MIPEGWKVTTLGDACDKELQTGPFGSQLHAEEYQDEGVAVIMPKDLIGGRVNYKGASKVSNDKAAVLHKHYLKPGDIVFSRRGDVSRSAYIHAGEELAICGTGCLRARLSSRYDSRLISCFLQKEQVKSWLEQNAVGQTMLNLNTTILGELPLLVSEDIAEQKVIASILSTWDRAIEKTEALIAAKERRKKGLMQRLLTGEVRFGEFVRSEVKRSTRFYDLPKDWSYQAIGRIAEPISIKNSNGAALLVLSCTKHAGLVDSLAYFGKQMFSKDLSTYKVVPRNAFAYATNHIEEGSIGYQDMHEKAAISPMYTVFKTTDEVDDQFLFKLLKTEWYRHIFEISTNASVDRRGSLRWKEFSKIKIPLPGLVEQRQISKVLDLAESEIQGLYVHLATLKEQKKGLMQQVLTGKVRVNCQ